MNNFVEKLLSIQLKMSIWKEFFSTNQNKMIDAIIDSRREVNSHNNWMHTRCDGVLCSGIW